MNLKLIVFDMDGVITTEEKYWACARLTFWEFVVQTLGHVGALPQQARQEAIHSEAARQQIVSDSLIYSLKSRAVNSNWDITYVLACVYLSALSGAKAFGVHEVPTLFEMLHKQALMPAVWPDALDAFLAHTDLIGRELIDYTGAWVQHALGNTDPTLFEPEGAFWWYLHSRFQRFYRGEAMREYGGEPLRDGTALPVEAIRATLADLRARGVRLAAATGRPMDELNDALGELGLLDFFEADRMGTLDRVREGEAALNRIGLVKPHPYSLLHAIYPEKAPTKLLELASQPVAHDDIMMVGDTTSDVIMAQAAGCRCIGVLTGVRSEAAKVERRQQLLDAGAALVLNDMTELRSLIGS